LKLARDIKKINAESNRLDCLFFLEKKRRLLTIRPCMVPSKMIVFKKPEFNFINNYSRECKCNGNAGWNSNISIKFSFTSLRVVFLPLKENV
jgi:hypothetical protein